VNFLADASIAETGIDLAGYSTLSISTLGTILMIVVGAFFAYALIRIALGWVGLFGSDTSRPSESETDELIRQHESLRD